MKIVGYDLEIRKAIPGKNGERKLGVEYCDGWHDHAGMGIACACFVTVGRGEPRVFGEKEAKGIQEVINWADKLVSFNGLGFDNKVLAAYGVIIPEVKCIDLMKVLLDQWQKRYKLDVLAKMNLGGRGKTEEGAIAPELWQAGEYTRVIDYCFQDVILTNRIYEKMQSGFLKDPYGLGSLRPVNLEAWMRKNGHSSIEPSALSIDEIKDDAVKDAANKKAALS